MNYENITNKNKSRYTDRNGFVVEDFGSFVGMLPSGKSLSVAPGKLEKYVELITLSRATLLMTIHGG